jgi:hypothetical protein
MKMKIVREINIPFEAMEDYTKKAFGLTVKLTEIFNLSTITELLGVVRWTGVLPVFIPQGVDNQRAVNSLVTAGHKKPYEGVKVMRYAGSEGYDKPRLFLIESSIRPNKNTMRRLPNNLVNTGKLWLPLKGYVIAQGVFHQITEEYLDQETYTWFPGETLDGGRAADGSWSPDFSCVGFGWRDLNCGYEDYGARMAISVPLLKS